MAIIFGITFCPITMDSLANNQILCIISDLLIGLGSRLSEGRPIKTELEASESTLEAAAFSFYFFVSGNFTHLCSLLCDLNL